MKIKKISDEILFRKTTTEFKFLVNGKKVSIYLYEDSMGLDDNYEIKQDENNKLTDEELELFTEDVYTLYDLKDNEEMEVEED